MQIGEKQWLIEHHYFSLRCADPVHGEQGWNYQASSLDEAVRLFQSHDEIHHNV